MQYSPIRQAGLTLIEALIVLCISALLLSTAIPSFQQAKARRQLDGAVAQFEVDVQFARSLALTLGKPVRLTFHGSSDGACYIVHTGAASDCACGASGGAQCRSSAESFRANHWKTGTLRLQANVGSMLFDDARGTVTPTATIRIDNGTGVVHQVVNIMGRVRSCSPKPPLSGYKTCPSSISP